MTEVKPTTDYGDKHLCTEHRSAAVKIYENNGIPTGKKTVTNRCLVNISGVSAALDKHIVIMD
jgi:hypothetical protein